MTHDDQCVLSSRLSVLLVDLEAVIGDDSCETKSTKFDTLQISDKSSRNEGMYFY